MENRCSELLNKLKEKRELLHKLNGDKMYHNNEICVDCNKILYYNPQPNVFNNYLCSDCIHKPLYRLY